jgi:hypothetical protein
MLHIYIYTGMMLLAIGNAKSVPRLLQREGKGTCCPSFPSSREVLGAPYIYIYIYIGSSLWWYEAGGDSPDTREERKRREREGSAARERGEEGVGRAASMS